MKLFCFFLLAFPFQFTTAQIDATQSPQKPTSQFAGLWEIDLRPSPEAAAYVKMFEIVPENEFISFGGTFYDTPFSGGLLNLQWPVTYFAFHTKDRKSQYFHSGYLEGDTLHGMTYSPERGFIMPWTGWKKKE